MFAAAAVGHVTRGLWENPDNAFLLRWLPMFLIGIVCAEFAARCERQEDLARRCGPAIIGIGMGLTIFFANRPVSLIIWVLVFSVSLGAWEKFFPKVGGVIGGLMRLSVAQWLGALSYPLYVLHWPFICGMLALLQWLKPDLNQRDTMVVLLMSGIPLLLGFAWIVHVCLEKPLMRYGKRITGRAGSLVSAPVPS